MSFYYVEYCISAINTIINLGVDIFLSGSRFFLRCFNTRVIYQRTGNGTETVTMYFWYFSRHLLFVSMSFLTGLTRRYPEAKLRRDRYVRKQRYLPRRNDLPYKWWRVNAFLWCCTFRERVIRHASLSGVRLDTRPNEHGRDGDRDSNFRLLACRLLISLVWHLSSLVKNHKRSQSASAANRTSVRIAQHAVKFLPGR